MIIITIIIIIIDFFFFFPFSFFPLSTKTANVACMRGIASFDGNALDGRTTPSAQRRMIDAFWSPSKLGQ